MTNLYTSPALITYSGTDPIEESTPEVDIFANGNKLTVEHYTAADVLIGTINPARSTVENHNGSDTRICIWPEAGQVAVGEKVKFILDDEA